MNSFKKATVLAAGTAALAMAGAGAASAAAEAEGAAVNSPGVLSGNNVQVPVHIPVNLCGNTVNVVGVLNPAIGNTCLNLDGVDKQNKHDKHDKHEAGKHSGNLAGGLPG